MGVHAVIYDKIDQYSNKQVKESVFLVEARESQRQLLVVAAGNSENAGVKTPPAPCTEPTQMLDVEKARQSIIDVSTATSLSSLESQVPEAKVVLPQNIC